MMSWNLSRLNLEACWEMGLTGSGVTVGHLDTGVDVAHPALVDRVRQFAEFDQNGEIIANRPIYDSSDHGTQTAGIICGGSINGQVIGVAPDAKLCCGMVIEGQKPLLRVLSGLDWMFDQPVRVICISLGVPTYNPIFEVILSRLRQQGILCIFPVGNSGRKQSHSPANYPGVISVGAIDPHDRVARFSGSQVFDRAIDPIKPNLVAPGINIPTAQPGGGLRLQDGTSMAAAHVAGVAAILFQAKPEATVTDIERALLTSCLPLHNVATHRMGWGLVNPVGALEKLGVGS